MMKTKTNRTTIVTRMGDEDDEREVDDDEEEEETDEDDVGMAGGDEDFADPVPPARKPRRHDSTPAPPPPPPPAVSRSWGEVAAHSTSYDGGKVVACRGGGARSLYGYVGDGPDGGADDGDGPDGDEGDGEDDVVTPFLLASCGGDVAIIDAVRGVKARTVRVGVAGSAGAEVAFQNRFEEDYDELDADAVTTFALSHNDIDLITASRNSVLRHYDLSGRRGVGRDSYGGPDGRGPAIVKRTFSSGGMSGRASPVRCLEFHASGVFFASGAVDGTAKVWDMRGGFATHSFKGGGSGGGRGGGVSSLAWAPGATRLILAVGTDDGSIQLFDLHENDGGGGGGGGGSSSSSVTTVELCGQHVSSVTCMRWTPSGDVLFTAGRDAVVNTWVLEEEQEQREEAEAKANKATRSRHSKKAKKARAGVKFSYKRVATLPVYEQVEGMELVRSHHVHGHGHGHSRSIVLATAGSGGRVRLWRAIRGDLASPDEPVVGDLECILSQPDGSCFGESRGGYTQLLPSVMGGHHDHHGEHGGGLVAVDAEHNLTFLDASDLGTRRTIIGHNDEILDLKVLPTLLRTDHGGDGSDKVESDSESGVAPSQRIAVATNSAQVRFFSLGTFSCEVLDGHTDTVLSLDVSPCGRFLVTCGKDKSMRLWHVASTRCVAVALGHTEAVGATALSRKVGRYEVGGGASERGGGAFACTASKDRTLKRWNLPGSAELETCASNGEVLSLDAVGSARAHDKDINIVAIAPNDSVIATGSQDRLVKIWRSTDLALQGTLTGHKRGVWDCQFSPFDRVVATASGDQTVKLWSLSNFGCLRTFQGHSASALRVRFLTGGLQLVSSGADGLVKLWTIRTNECEATMDGHSDKVWALDLSPLGDVLVSGGADSRLVVWSDTTAAEEKAKRDEEEHSLLMEQRLSNHLRFKEYDQALDLALELDKPLQTLKVLTALVENDIQSGRAALATLQHHVKTWPMNRTTQVLRYCRDWNTRARNSNIAMLVIRAVLSSIPANKLASADGVPEILAGVTPYAERHFERLDKIYADSYLLDFTLFSMGSLISDEDVARWEGKEKYVLPPKRSSAAAKTLGFADGSGEESGNSDDEVLTVGDSDTGSESSRSRSGEGTKGNDIHSDTDTHLHGSGKHKLRGKKDDDMSSSESSSVSSSSSTSSSSCSVSD